MKINTLKLINFRNYKKLEINFNDKWNILVGENGAGKTNILEALYYSITTKSFRTTKIDNLVKYGEKNFYLNVEFKDNDIEILSSIENFYQKSETYKKSQKNIKLNKTDIKLLELLGIIPFIFFVPDDILIIKGDGENRRKLFDFILYQIFPNYKFLFNKYFNVLKKRNLLLKEIKQKNINVNTQILEIWDENLIKLNIKIFKKRYELSNILNKKFMDEKNLFFIDNFGKHNKKNISVKYNSIFLKENLNIENENELYAFFKKILIENYEKDKILGFTSIGIHRDDWQFFYNEKDIKIFGSQGEMRFFVLIVKIILSNVIFDYLGKRPILIFDDIFSELDILNTKILIDTFNKYNSQIFITTVDIDKLKTNNLFKNANLDIFNVKNGNIF